MEYDYSKYVFESYFFKKVRFKQIPAFYQAAIRYFSLNETKFVKFMDSCIELIDDDDIKPIVISFDEHAYIYGISYVSYWFEKTRFNEKENTNFKNIYLETKTWLGAIKNNVEYYDESCDWLYQYLNKENAIEKSIPEIIYKKET
jgi:hypothetical protein